MKTRPRNQITTKPPLRSYLAVTAGAGCASSVASAAVTFYGVDSANDTNPNPAGIDIMNGALDSASSSDTVFPFYGGFAAISDGTINRSFTTVAGNGSYLGGFRNYADYSYVLAFTASIGDQNYVPISFNGDDGIYEAVAQINFTSHSIGWLVAIARNDDNSAMTQIEGKTMIDAASVPEPTSLSLLALGAAGVAMRRRRKQLN